MTSADVSPIRIVVADDRPVVLASSVYSLGREHGPLSA